MYPKRKKENYWWMKTHQDHQESAPKWRAMAVITGSLQITKGDQLHAPSSSGQWLLIRGGSQSLSLTILLFCWATKKPLQTGRAIWTLPFECEHTPEQYTASNKHTEAKKNPTHNAIKFQCVPTVYYMNVQTPQNRKKKTAPQKSLS